MRLLRLGGDEFGIVGFDLRHAQDADRTAARIIADIRRPYTIQGHSVEIGVSIGVSMCPIHATEHGELLENPDLALYEAKGAGRMRSALPLVPVSLNLSAMQFLSLDLVGVCYSMSRELDVGLEWLRFDVEETVLHADFPRAADKIAALSRLGILINVDHFGQGLVPLNRICDVKLNQLKITNKYFETGPAMNRNDALIAIIHQVGQVLRVPIVATQIETEAMGLRATSAGIDYLQGNLISRPLMDDAAEGWLKNRIGREEAV